MPWRNAFFCQTGMGQEAWTRAGLELKNFKTTHGMAGEICIFGQTPRQTSTPVFGGSLIELYGHGVKMCEEKNTTGPWPLASLNQTTFAASTLDGSMISHLRSHILPQL